MNPSSSVKEVLMRPGPTGDTEQVTSASTHLMQEKTCGDNDDRIPFAAGFLS